ncbi:MAG: response regulator transcription factor [Bacteroidetes bacterium]|nr:MAG: response regulator transcription factor [Bacteroidota bacterium]TNE99529.1 MAG: response regulator transcription factor [Bacteroidota bacterium]
MKVVIADSSELMRLGIRSLLKTELDVEIVGEAHDGDELLELIKNFEIDLVIIDYTSMGFSVDNVAKLRSVYPNLNVLAITPEQSAIVLVDALKAGVTSYVKKDCSFPEIIDAVKSTYKGDRFFCGQILETIHLANLNVDEIDLDALTCDPVTISKRESEIITMIAEGYTNTQIADQLFLSAHTVNTHRKNIMSKLGVKNTAGIVMYAVKTNLISPNKFLFTAENENL